MHAANLFRAATPDECGDGYRNLVYEHKCDIDRLMVEHLLLEIDIFGGRVVADKSGFERGVRNLW